MQATIANTVTEAELNHLGEMAATLSELLIARDQDDEAIIWHLEHLDRLTNRGWQDTVDALRGMVDDQSENGTMTPDQADMADHTLTELIAKVDRMTGWPELHG
jgi:hypothetical protein